MYQFLDVVPPTYPPNRASSQAPIADEVAGEGVPSEENPKDGKTEITSVAAKLTNWRYSVTPNVRTFANQQSPG